MEKVALIQKRPGSPEKIPMAVKIPEAPDDEKISGYFSSLSRCLNERRAIEMVYRAQHTKEVTNRVVDPYGLVFYEGMWTVIGYCYLRKDIRTFAFDRMLDLKERNLYFKPREDFGLGEYLSKSWGIVEDEEETYGSDSCQTWLLRSSNSRCCFLTERIYREPSKTGAEHHNTGRCRLRDRRSRKLHRARQVVLYLPIFR